jgi:hypothetical protein
VAAVENANRGEIRRAAWLFPLYLVAINLFVIPIAVAGLLLLPPGTDGDTFVLALPVEAQSQTFALIAFIGGLSASTAMVIVECIALSIMVCNNLVVPLMLRRQVERAAVHQDMGGTLLPDDRLFRGTRPGGSVVFRGGSAVRPGVSRRARLAARDGAGRHVGHCRGLRGVGLYASAAGLRRCRLDRPRLH